MKSIQLSKVLHLALAVALLAGGAARAEQPVRNDHEARGTYRGIHKKQDAAAPVALAGTGHLVYYGGKVLATVEVVNVNWGPNTDSAVTSNMGAFYTAVTNSAYFDWQSEYNTVGLNGQDGQPGSNQTIGRGTFKSSITITPTNTSTNVTDAQIQTELQGQISAGHLPAPTIDAQGNAITIYMVNFPPNMTEHDPSGGSNCVQFCAYHGTMTIGGRSVGYAVLPDLGGGCATGCGGSTKFNNSTSVASHELMEAVTDLEVGIGTTVGRPLAWYDSVNGENGDICNAQQGTIAGYTVQKLWSNASNACIISKAATGNNFSIALSPASQSVAAGSSVSYTVTTAVTSGVAESLSLAVSGLPAGVTGSFSPATVTAGGSSTLTLTAASSAAAATATFTVTATGASASHAATAGVTVTTTTGGGDIALSSGVAKAGSVSGATANAGWVYYTIAVPAGATNLAISVNGLSADADLYDRAPATAGSTATHPTTASYTGRSWNSGTTAESLAHASPIAGTWSIGVTNYATGTISYTITATVTTATATYTISGNAGTTGATVTAGTASATSDASSNFTLSGLAAGTYTVTPAKTGCTFTPANRSVTVGPSATAVNFTASCGGGSTQLLGNPGFENGSTNTAPWTTTSGVVDNGTGEAAHSGSWKAWMNGYGSTHTDSILQTVAIPSTATTATLSFWLHIDSAETTTTTAYDTLKVQVRNGSGVVLATLATYSNLNKATGYTQKSFNVLAYKGQTVQVYLVGAEDASAQTSFVVDDFALTVQ